MGTVDTECGAEDLADRPRGLDGFRPDRRPARTREQERHQPDDSRQYREC